MSFYVTLSSSCESDFITLLDPPLSFDSSFEVALVELTYSVCFTTKAGSLECKTMTESSIKDLVIDDRMSIYDFINVLSLLFGGIITGKYNSRDKKLTLKGSDPQVLLKPDKQLQNLLHSNPDRQFTNVIDCRIDNKIILVHNFFIFCDIISDQIINDQKEKLLKIVTVAGKSFDVINKQYKPHYIPINKTLISSIHINITDELRSSINFYRGPLILKLHFRKKIK